MSLFGNSMTNVNSQTMGNSAISDFPYVSRQPDSAVSQLGKIPVGRTFQGEVMDVVNKTVTIRLDNGQTLQATMQEPIQFNIGEKVQFQVKSNDGALIEIRPYSDPAQGLNSTMLKALDAANLPLTDRTAAMLMSLMQEQMPIDKASLQRMYKMLLSNEMADPATLVQMTKNHIPITEENIAQFENYKNFQHQIAPQAQTLGNQTAELLSELFTEGNSHTAQFHGQLLAMLAPKEGEVFKGFAGEGEATLQGEQSVLEQKQAALNPSKEGMPVIEGQERGEALQMGEGLAQELTETTLDENLSNNADALQTREGIAEGESQLPVDRGLQMSAEENAQASIQENAQAPIRENAQASIQENTQTFMREETGLSAAKTSEGGLPPREGSTPDVGALNQNLSERELQSLFASVRHLPFTQDQLQSLRMGTMNLNEFFYHLNQFQKEGFDLSFLLPKGEYHKLIKQQLGDRFLITPEEVFSREKVENYYSRLREQTQSLEKMFEMAGKSDSAAARTNQGISDNVDFMNQLNQMFTYVQLPLKMAGKSAHGDLYVFTNKKNLRQKEGALSALLHLDMTALGSMDIYVKMNQNHVSLRFQLEQEKIVEFLGQNMDVLVKNLKRHGYDTTTELLVAPKQPDFVKDFLEQEQPTAPMQRFSFDVRA